MQRQSHPGERDCQAVNGLHWQITPLIAKLAMLPITSPPTRKKLAIVAATSTSSIRPSRCVLCSSDGALIIHKLET